MRKSIFRALPRYGVLIATCIALLDQLSKYMVEVYIAPEQTIVISPWLNLTLHHNAGAGFSLLSNAGGWQRYLFIGISLYIITILIKALKNSHAFSYPERLSTGLASMLGGAFGNLCDRITRGSVTDFIDFHIHNFHFSTFNVADMAIVLGAAILFTLFFTLSPSAYDRLFDIGITRMRRKRSRR
jgi:signal peptidase II